MAVNKVIYGDQVLIDLADSTVTPETLAAGVIAYNAAGERILGTNTGAGGLKNYSENEIDTGIKWIDGKTIYRRTYSGGAIAAGGSVTLGELNASEVDTLVSMRGAASGGGVLMPIPYVFGTSYQIYILAANNAITVGTVGVSVEKCSVTAEYTKTADALPVNRLGTDALDAFTLA